MEVRGGMRLLVLGLGLGQVLCCDQAGLGCDRVGLVRHAFLTHTPPCARGSGSVVVLCVLAPSWHTALVRTVRARVVAQPGGQRCDAGWASGRCARLAAGQSCGTAARSPGPYAGFARSQLRAGLPGAWRARAWKPWRALAGGPRVPGPLRASGCGPCGGSERIPPAGGASHGAGAAARHDGCERGASRASARDGGTRRSRGRPGLAADAQVGA